MKKIIALFLALIIGLSLCMPCFAADGEWVNTKTGVPLKVGDVLSAGSSIKNTKYNGGSYSDGKCLFLLNGSTMMTTGGVFEIRNHEFIILALTPKLSAEFIYTLNFDTSGGTLNTSSPVKVHANSTFGKLPVPKKAGYKFLGWEFDGQLITENTPAPKFQWGKLTLKAMWEEGAPESETATSQETKSHNTPSSSATQSGSVQSKVVSTVSESTSVSSNTSETSEISVSSTSASIESESVSPDFTESQTEKEKDGNSAALIIIISIIALALVGTAAFVIYKRKK